ncbi:2OG-Fe(II) oxygenase [Streptomyces sp. NPDC040724]|uniref:2OG-Fe(II) oxygenase n=1 Tax=Streptomyces sp. NPDC040724 TaxID=3155612 RepID=UPI0033E39EC1
MTGSADVLVQDSPLGRNAIWQPSTPLCRISNFLGESASGALLERAVSAAGTDLSPSRVRNNQLEPRIRRSLTHRDFAAPELTDAIEAVLDRVAQTLGVSCRDTRPTYSLIAHNDGDFYGPHQDAPSGSAASGAAAGRRLSFVYYMHRTPARFTGGQLRIYDAAAPLHAGHRESRPGTFRDVDAEHDSIVFFRPSALHEVRPVICPTHAYEDSRFAINGWMCRASGS